jgi:hypothetical protein
MTIVAPDIQISPNLPPPVGMSVSASRPLVISTMNTAGFTLRAVSESAELVPIDPYGVATAGATALPAPLAASGRWLVRYTGAAGAVAPLAFT